MTEPRRVFNRDHLHYFMVRGRRPIPRDFLRMFYRVEMIHHSWSHCVRPIPVEYIPK